jgi:hypothetical protein
MNRHPYLRAYMAGITFPIAFLPFLVGAVLLTGAIPRQMALGFLFPLIVIPNAFGLWNMLYVKLHSHWRHPIGLHGAALPFFIAPLGLVVLGSAGLVQVTGRGVLYVNTFWIPYWYFVFAPFVALAAYYLIWKYAVGFLNRMLELPV